MPTDFLAEHPWLWLLITSVAFIIAYVLGYRPGGRPRDDSRTTTIRGAFVAESRLLIELITATNRVAAAIEDIHATVERDSSAADERRHRNEMDSLKKALTEDERRHRNEMDDLKKQIAELKRGT